MPFLLFFLNSILFPYVNIPIEIFCCCAQRLQFDCNLFWKSFVSFNKLNNCIIVRFINICPHKTNIYTRLNEPAFCFIITFCDVKSTSTHKPHTNLSRITIHTPIYSTQKQHDFTHNAHRGSSCQEYHRRYATTNHHHYKFNQSNRYRYIYIYIYFSLHIALWRIF